MGQMTTFKMATQTAAIAVVSARAIATMMMAAAATAATAP